jgi:hypothetical protein
MAWHSQRGGEPGRMEQRLCRPVGREFGRAAILILDGGVVKPFSYFWLSLELYLSQVCLQLLFRISGSAHEVCGSVSITILDLSAKKNHNCLF